MVTFQLQAKTNLLFRVKPQTNIQPIAYLLQVLTNHNYLERSTSFFLSYHLLLLPDKMLLMISLRSLRYKLSFRAVSAGWLAYGTGSVCRSSSVR